MLTMVSAASAANGQAQAPSNRGSQPAAPPPIARFYPDRAQRLGVAGRVVLACVAQADGTVAD